MAITHEFQNPPSPKLLEKIGATNLTVADAIAELVANSFDAASDGGGTIVDVAVDPDFIRVTDNGVGMSLDVLRDAVKLGVDMSGVVTKRADTKGKFGLGMKTACSSLGRWWSVRTRPEGEDKEYYVSFDLAEWERRTETPDSWKMVIEELECDQKGPLGNQAHGTAVEVRQVRTKDPMAGAVLKKLGESFKPHLERGDVVRVNGTPAIPHEYKFVSGSKIDIDVSFGPESEPDKFHVTGWVAVDQQTHNDGQYGFNIYRHGQLVQTWYKGWIRAHLMTSRIIGEVHMDFIDATFFKLGLQESEVWRMAGEYMKEYLKPVVTASMALSRKGNINNRSKRTEIVDALRESFGLPNFTPDSADLAQLAASDSSVTKIGSEPASRDELPALPRFRVEGERITLASGEIIVISWVEWSLGPQEPPFDYLEEDGETIGLQTAINTDHRLYQGSKDLEQLRRLAVADCILRYLCDKVGLGVRSATEIRNSWLDNALRNRGVVEADV